VGLSDGSSRAGCSWISCGGGSSGGGTGVSEVVVVVLDVVLVGLKW